jgi:hypothetical protein
LSRSLYSRYYEQQPGFSLSVKMYARHGRDLPVQQGKTEKKHKTRREIALALNANNPAVDNAFPVPRYEDDDSDEPEALVESYRGNLL